MGALCIIMDCPKTARSIQYVAQALGRRVKHREVYMYLSNFSHTEPKRSENLGGNSIDETRMEIARESERIRREMEKERRSKSPTPARDKPPPARDRSPTRTFLTLTTVPKVYDYSGSSNNNINNNDNIQLMTYVEVDVECYWTVNIILTDVER